MLNTQPVYMQLAEFLQERINSNVYGLGNRIPSERELTETLGISRLTVRKAINVLIERGLLVRVQGKGTFVTSPKLNSPLDDGLESMGKFIQEQGLLPSNKVLSCEVRKAGTKYARIFHISPKDNIFQLFRLRLGNGKPIVLEYTYIPCSIIPDIETYNFEYTSLYDLFKKHEIKTSYDYQELEIVNICNPQAKLLELEENTSVFMLHNTVISENKQILEHTKSYISGNTVTFSSILT